MFFDKKSADGMVGLATRSLASIGARLTLWGAGTTLLVCVTICVVLYSGMRFSLIREVDAFLHGELDELVAKVNEQPGDLPAAEQAIRRELDNRPGSDLSFRLYDATGQLLITSDPGDVLHESLRPEEGDVTTAAEPLYRTFDSPLHPFPLRNCIETVRGEGGAMRIAQASYSMRTVAHSLDLLRNLSLASLAVATLLALAAGWFLARRALRPVGLMAETAGQIGASRLTDRLERSGRGDEFDRLAETFNRMLDRIEEHVRRVQQFTADASHEFRGPLSALRGMAEVALTRSRSADELREVIETSVGEYERLQRLSEDLLLLSLSDSDVQRIDKRPVALNDVIQDATELFGPVAEEAGLRLSHRAGPEIEVIGDGGRLRQLAGNLIDNAIKYNRPSGEIEVALEQLDGRARITVRDTGIGITAADLPRVFDRFFRADRSRASTGTGLGLAICRWIVEAHGGTIRLDSVPDQGTRVSIDLPV